LERNGQNTAPLCRLLTLGHLRCRHGVMEGFFPGGGKNGISRGNSDKILFYRLRN